MLIKNTPRREYRLKDDTLVPGVTTVLEVLAKPALHKWFWQGGYDCGVEWCGRDPDKEYPEITFQSWREEQKDNTAGVGTIAHYKIHCYLTGQKEEYGPEWEEEHIKMAQVPFEKFVAYYESIKGRPILTEYSCVHEKLRYGGTLDLLADTKDGPFLIDIKTSKNIYEEYYIQLEAYYMLLAQDSKWRQLRPYRRVVLVTKDGRLEAPDVSKAYMDKARATWDRLIKMYHKLADLRKAWGEGGLITRSHTRSRKAA